MKRLFYLLICATGAVSATLHAQPDSEKVKAALESYSTCERFVRYDDENVYLGFGTNLSNLGPEKKFPPLEVRVISIADPKIVRTLTTEDSALDLARTGNTLWILTYTGLEQWDLGAGTRVATYPTYNFKTFPMEYKEHPTGMVLYKNNLIIAHGRLGFSVFDTVRKMVVQQSKLITGQAPKESMATGIALAGNHAYLILDSFTLSNPDEAPAFRGIVVLNGDSLAVEGALDGMDPGADAAASDGKNLIVSFWGLPIWKYSIAKLTGTRVPTPEVRLWKFPVAGHPTDIPSLDAKYYFTCFTQAPVKPGGKYINAPRALDRSALGL